MGRGTTKWWRGYSGLFAIMNIWNRFFTTPRPCGHPSSQKGTFNPPRLASQSTPPRAGNQKGWGKKNARWALKTKQEKTLFNPDICAGCWRCIRTNRDCYIATCNCNRAICRSNCRYKCPSGLCNITTIIRT